MAHAEPTMNYLINAVKGQRYATPLHNLMKSTTTKKGNGTVIITSTK